jgi:hypothetical protein
MASRHSSENSNIRKSTNIVDEFTIYLRINFALYMIITRLPTSNRIVPCKIKV